jgi:hypothetical protein
VALKVSKSLPQNKRARKSVYRYIIGIFFSLLSDLKYTSLSVEIFAESLDVSEEELIQGYY